MTSLADPSSLTQGTGFKSYSTLQKASVADTTITVALPRPAQLAPPTAPPTSRGPLATRKMELERKKQGSKGRHHGIAKTTNIHSVEIEGAHT